VCKHHDVVAVAEPNCEELRRRSFTREFDLPPGVAHTRLVAWNPASGALVGVSRRERA
jgi:hypothetical protein